MFLSQKYHTNRKSISDGNLNKWIAYESFEQIPESRDLIDFSPAPIKIQEFFFECFDDDLATELGWRIAPGPFDEKTLYIPVRRFCFLENGKAPSPTIRYYMDGDWLTAKQAQYQLAHYIR